MIAIDTLVHNFLHRTGIAQTLGSAHPYGPACYAEHGCAEIMASLSSQIDARAFNPAYPQVFPRFVQHAIWRYCAQGGLSVCNEASIAWREACRYCRIRQYCACIL